VSSNVSQTYPYSSEDDESRAAAVSAAFETHEGLAAKIEAEASPLGPSDVGENGAPMKWWTWVCPACIEGRLHVAGFLRDRHGLYTVCDRCGSTFSR